MVIRTLCGLLAFYSHKAGSIKDVFYAFLGQPAPTCEVMCIENQIGDGKPHVLGMEIRMASI